MFHDISGLGPRRVPALAKPPKPGWARGTVSGWLPRPIYSARSLNEVGVRPQITTRPMAPRHAKRAPEG
jgi:hypothetical protein